MKLELKHIASYLPYAVKIYDYNAYPVCGFFEMNHNGGTGMIAISELLASPRLYKIALRPIYDLTNEISHNGRKFIPIEALLDIETEINWSSSDHLNTDFMEKTHYTKIEGGSTFGYNESGYFYIIDKYDRYCPVKKQKELFETMYEWGIDLNGLIDQGLAIDINTIEL